MIELRLSTAVYLCCAALCAMPSAVVAQADMLKPAGSPWNVPEKIPEGKDVSGIACVPVSDGLRNCIVAVDEAFSAVFVTLDSNTKTVKVGDKIRLLPKKEGQELDAEGAAYDPDTNAFYIIGSHGKSRHTCKDNPSAFSLVKIPVDSKTGRPSFDFKGAGDDFVAKEITVTASIKAAMLASDKVAPQVDKCVPSKKGNFPSAHGANIEGLAVLGNRLYVGLRGPVDGATAYMLSLDRDAVFAQEKPTATTVEVKLGDGMGVRDLAAVKGGLLILSGPEDDVPGKAAIHFFEEGKGSISRLGAVPDPTDNGKPEALLLLDETDATYRVLMLSDSVKNGEPTEFLIDKKK